MFLFDSIIVSPTSNICYLFKGNGTTTTTNAISVRKNNGKDGAYRSRKTELSVKRTTVKYLVAQFAD